MDPQQQNQQTPLYKKQQKRYTILLQEQGKAIQQFQKIQCEVLQLDKERRQLKQKLKAFMAKVGFQVSEQFIQDFERL